MSGQFGFMSSIGATDRAVATLNDQPHIFFTIVGALVAITLESVLIWYIDFATRKPEQKKAKEDKKKKKAEEKAKKKGASKPAAMR